MKKPNNFVAVYHCTAGHIPFEIRSRLHNVLPELIYQQVEWIKRHFDIVTIDDWFASTDTIGKAAITFDDGYRSVFEEALPILLELNVPSTVFLCGRMLEGGVFWRDKVRFLELSGLVSDFCENVAHKYVLDSTKIGDDFFLQTREPGVDSAQLDMAIDRFFEKRGLLSELERLREPFVRSDQLIDHPLVTYGNHTYNHYVLSSLDSKQQRSEIEKMEILLDKLKVRRSKVFCLPFGESKDANDVTFDICGRAGFTGFLYCRNVVQYPVHFDPLGQLLIGDRFLIPSNFRKFRNRLSALDSFVDRLTRNLLPSTWIKRVKKLSSSLDREGSL